MDKLLFLEVLFIERQPNELHCDDAYTATNKPTIVKLGVLFTELLSIWWLSDRADMLSIRNSVSSSISRVKSPVDFRYPSCVALMAGRGRL